MFVLVHFAMLAGGTYKLGLAITVCDLTGLHGDINSVGQHGKVLATSKQ